MVNFKDFSEKKMHYMRTLITDLKNVDQVSWSFNNESE